MPGSTSRFIVEEKERIFGGDEEVEEINVGEWCELLNELLVRFDGSAEKLKEELSIASDRE